MQRNKQAGITLIALVVTIIILIILAGISIGALTGDNGILSQTHTAKRETEKSDIEEQINIIVVENSKDRVMDKEKLINDFEERLPDGKEIVESDDLIYIIYPEYSFEVDIDSLDVAQVEIDKAEDETPWELAGSGTETDPYLIESIEDLVAFSNNVNSGTSYSGKYVKLTTNLDFNLPFSYNNPKTKVSEKTNRIIEEDSNGTELKTFLTSGTGFNPIGKIGKDFSGTFEGNGKVIKNIYINRPEEDDVGLFGSIYESSVGNLGIIGNIKGNKEIGGLGGKISYGEINNIFSNVKIEGNNGKMGGISGTISDTNIKNCYNINELTSYGTSNSGIVGYNSSNCNIENCYNSGIIRGKGDNGGILGDGEAVIKNCYNLGEIHEIQTGSNNTGGICGSLRPIGYIDTAYNKGKVIGTYQVGGIVGQIFSSIRW